MSNEIADALRRLADSIEQGASVPNPIEACVVLSNEAGTCSASYIGRKVPSRDAGLFLLASGMQRFVVGMPPVQTAAPAAPLFGTGIAARSTH